MNNSTGCALIFLSVLEPNKAPDIRYISVGSSDSFITDSEFESSAITFFKEISNYPDGTKFISKGVQRFESFEAYLLFAQNQLHDYLESLSKP